MTLLATSESIAVVNLVVSGLLTVAVAYLGYKAREVGDLKKELAESTDQAIEQKFQARDTQCDMKHKLVSTEMVAIQRRLDKGDNAFDRNGENEHRLEIKLIAMISELKQDMAKMSARLESIADWRSREGMN